MFVKTRMVSSVLSAAPDSRVWKEREIEMNEVDIRNL